MKIRLIAAAASFGVLYCLALFAAKGFHDSRVLTLIAIAGAVAAFAWFLVEEIRTLSDLDELQRRIELEALAIAFPLSIVLILALGLLQRVVVLSPGDWSYRHIWPLMFAFYFMGRVIAGRRYR